MAKTKMTTTRRSDAMINSFEANAARWNKDAEQYRPSASDTSETNKSGDDDRITALTKQISDLQGQLNRPVVVNVPAVDTRVTSQPRQPAAVDYKGLPDPVQDPEGYAAALGQRLLAAADANNNYKAERAATVKNSQDERDQLFNDFASKKEYATIAKDADGVEFAATKVLKRMQARKQDVNAYMFSQSEKFFADVAKEYAEIFGEQDEEDEPAPTGQQEEPEPATRTGGIPGGLGGGTRPAAKAEKTSDLYTEVRAIQHKGGWY